MLKPTRFSKLAIGAALASVILCGGAQAQSSDTTLEALLDSKEILDGSWKFPAIEPAS